MARTGRLRMVMTMVAGLSFMAGAAALLYAGLSVLPLYFTNGFRFP